MSVNDLWNRHLIMVEDDRQFVDCKLLEEILGKEIENKFRYFEKLISEMVAGTGLVAKDLIRNIIMVRKRRSPSVCIAARTMQLILLHGFKNMPWNDVRRNLVEYFFPQDVLPYVDPHKARKPMSETPDDNPTCQKHTTTIQHSWSAGACLLKSILPKHQMRASSIKAWKKPGGAVKFWRHVFWFARYRGIDIQGLLEFVKRNAATHHRKSRKGFPNLTKILLFGLVSNRGSTRDFSDNLSIAMRTGNAEMIINVIRKHFATPGMQVNLVPSIRSIQRSTASFVHNFIALCKPERTHSGFRVDLVSSVKIAAFLLLKTADVDGLRVDIWGDGCEIGGMEVTRLTFRLLCVTAGPTGPSAQSSDAVFCFAGKFLLIMLIAFKLASALVRKAVKSATDGNLAMLFQRTAGKMPDFHWNLILGPPSLAIKNLGGCTNR